MSQRFSQAADNNKQVILEQLQQHLGRARKVLEIGSGTGQHAAHFAPNLPHLQWQTSDLTLNHPSVNAYIDEVNVANLLRPVRFEIGTDPWPAADADAVYSANTTHIMAPELSAKMMQMVADNLPEGGVFCQYGPYRFNGQYTSESNAAFDQHLANEGCGGIRDVAELQRWADPRRLQLEETIAMPANNHLLVWRRINTQATSSDSTSAGE